jgi:cell division cycle protein 20 (cofactor of APC complex)
LDAPGLIGDYYLNLVDWSPDNTVAIALSQAVYLLKGETGETVKLCELEGADDYVSSVSWLRVNGRSTHLAVGTNGAQVQLWDVQRQKQVRAMGGHTARVPSLAWNAHLLSSGSRDSTIINHDVRIANHAVATLRGHEQEVVGMQWGPEFSGGALATGGNDNILNIWDPARLDAPRHQLRQHTAAVRAVAWCPWERNTLASGGGTADRHLRFWNTSTGECTGAIDTESQISAIQWNSQYRELATSHGFSKNQVCLWSYPSLSKVGELFGHTGRVLQLAQSPDGTTLASASEDESLQMWSVWPKKEGGKGRRVGVSGSGREGGRGLRKGMAGLR